MKEFFVHNQDEFLQVSGYTCDHFESGGGPLRYKITESSGNGKWGMARLWRKWMAITAQYMANNGSKMPLMVRDDGTWYGSRPFDENDAHELFTRQWLGVDVEGNRLSWKKKEGANVADKGQRFIAMMKHQNWCIEKGIDLPLPRDSEYNELQEQQNQ